jgi:hypothetical protein
LSTLPAIKPGIRTSTSRGLDKHNPDTLCMSSQHVSLPQPLRGHFLQTITEREIPVRFCLRFSSRQFKCECGAKDPSSQLFHTKEKTDQHPRYTCITLQDRRSRDPIITSTIPNFTFRPEQIRYIEPSLANCSRPRICKPLSGP